MSFPALPPGACGPVPSLERLRDGEHHCTEEVMVRAELVCYRRGTLGRGVMTQVLS